jgi:hypothetical protein
MPRRRTAARRADMRATQQSDENPSTTGRAPLRKHWHARGARAV